MSNKYFIGFNGPPGSGKDTAAEMAITYLFECGYTAIHVKFAQPLKSATAMLLGVERISEDMKSQPTPYNGVTWRKALIEMSETYAKPLFGEDFFGKRMIQFVERFTDLQKSIVFVGSDCGFHLEQLVTCEHFTPDRYALIRIQRPGHTFEGDSRSYIRDVGKYGGDIHNTTTWQNLWVDTRAEVERIIKTAGWTP